MNRKTKLTFRTLSYEWRVSERALRKYAKKLGLTPEEMAEMGYKDLMIKAKEI